MVMKSKHDSKDISLLDFYQKYPNLVDNAKKIVSIFGSKYICEQLFSKMKLTKSKLRTALTDSHLDGALRLSSSSLKPKHQKNCAEQTASSISLISFVKPVLIHCFPAVFFFF